MERMRRLAIAALAASALVATAAWAQQQPQQQPRRGGNIGRVTAVSDTGFDLTVGRAGNQRVVKVTVSAETRFFEARRVALSDLKQGATVLVVGTREGNKITARGILDVSAVGQVPERLVRGLANVVRGGGRRPQGGGQPGRGNPPVVGTVSSTSPLQVSAGGQTLEAVPAEQVNVLALQAFAQKDLKVGDFVSVQAAPNPDPQAPLAARAVIKVPAPQRRGQ